MHPALLREFTPLKHVQLENPREMMILQDYGEIKCPEPNKNVLPGLNYLVALKATCRRVRAFSHAVDQGWASVFLGGPGPTQAHPWWQPDEWKPGDRESAQF
ncbi:hypothetical protein EAI_04984 [Harpegnathos saltator]|uniref:Uncharacterized protein n=1 Tax=Harpegnathos saltator TaxID=610380 RepID=E2C175_HARSA|nr:hypothetical protein EAI_04984 [Harpegnathos saltator]